MELKLQLRHLAWMNLFIKVALNEWLKYSVCVLESSFYGTNFRELLVTFWHFTIIFIVMYMYMYNIYEFMYLFLSELFSQKYEALHRSKDQTGVKTLDYFIKKQTDHYNNSINTWVNWK